MAPWPEVGERKAPDKEDHSSKIVELVPKGELSTDISSASGSDKEQKPEDREVLTLDENQLKALLDEAITYKNPKDREGKSELFKELLHEAEADQSDNKGAGKLPKSYYNLPPKKRYNRLQGRECGVGVSTSRGGSLQNLHALGMEGMRGVRSRRTGLVSGRQREGGSLPSNVNSDDIDTICPNYTTLATLQVTEAPASLQTAPVPNGTVNATNREVKRSENVRQTAAVSCLSQPPQQHVSMLSIPPSQLNSTQDDERLYPAATLLGSLVDPGPEELAGRTFILPIPAHWRRYSSCTFFDIREFAARLAALNKESTEPKVKPFDENGNALRPVESISYPDKRKPRRTNKTKNERNSRDFMSNEIEGYRGGADIETVMEFIENTSNLEGHKSNKNRPSEPRSSLKARESRPIKGRTRDKMNRCTSLEEISKTKMEDLTEEGSSERINASTLSLNKSKVSLDGTEVGKTSSWDELRKTKRKIYNTKIDSIMPQEGKQESEFHTVTKKNRKKKMRPINRAASERVETKPVFSAHDGSLEYRPKTVKGQTRRKSASSVPPSDKSDSSDLDSVHSLPVSSSMTRTKVGNSSVSGGSTPQASYADIAKTVNTCQDVTRVKFADSKAQFMLPSSCLTKKSVVTYDICDSPIHTKEEFPPLDVKPVDVLNTSCKSKCIRHKDIEIEENVPHPADHTLCEILSEPPISNQNLSELTFGFDVNPRLLESDNTQYNYSRSPSTVTSPILSQPTNPGDSCLEDVTYTGPVNQQVLGSFCSDNGECLIIPKRPNMDHYICQADKPVVLADIKFGYEVNQRLLEMDNLAHIDDPQLEMVNFLKSAWEQTEQGLKANKVIYYEEENAQ